MSLMVGSLSKGSSGPKPVISSKISLTNSFSSLVLSARRSTRMYWLTSLRTCSRISVSGSFSSAERLISSIRRRCSLTLASSSLSDSSGLTGAATASRTGVASGNTVHEMPSSVEVACSSGRGSGGAERRALKRPAMPNALLMSGRPKLSACEREVQLLRLRLRLGGSGLGRGRRDQLLELLRDLVARLDFLQRHAAIDRLAHEPVDIRDASGKILAQRLLDVAFPQARGEQALLEAIDDDLWLRAFSHPFANSSDQVLGVFQPRHRHLGDDEELVRAQQHGIGPGEPGARHVDDDIVEIRGGEIEQPRHHHRIKSAHLSGAVRRRNHRQSGGMIGQHYLQHLAVEPFRPRLDFLQIESRLEIEIIGARAVL